MSPTTPGPLPRVLMVTSNFHPREGGTERQARLLGRLLVARGARVSVVTPRSPASGDGAPTPSASATRASVQNAGAAAAPAPFT